MREYEVWNDAKQEVMYRGSRWKCLAFLNEYDEESADFPHLWLRFARDGNSERLAG